MFILGRSRECAARMERKVYIIWHICRSPLEAEMPIDKLKNIEPSDLDKTVWRYLTFPKFISLLAYGTVWFSKLNILTDQYEGHMPTETDAEMRAEWDRMKFT